jgi:PAS domain S-box-containing protein
MSSSALQNAQTHEQTVQLYTRTDEALARRVEQLQALLDSTHEGVLLFNPAGELLLVNQLAAEYLGQPASELLHRPLPLSLVNERLGYAPAELEQLWEQLQQDMPPAGRRTRFQAAGRYVERQESPVLAHTGRVMGWLVVLRDVTEEQEQLAWRTHFTNMMVHDLRNPITTLLSVLHRLSQKTEQEVQPLIQSGVHTSHHLLDMVDSLLDVNRLEAGQLLVEAEAMRLPPLVEKVVANLRPTAAEKQITLQVSSPAGLPAVWADEELVRRILVNLLDNALKFTPQGGQITVELRPEPSETAEPGVRCLITDSGPGIPAGDKERIFERFVRIHSGGAQVQGTGIGLSFCQLAVTAQDGRIWVEDAPQGGSCFLFTLPGIPEFPAGG